MTEDLIEHLKGTIDGLDTPRDSWNLLQSTASGYTICIADVSLFPISLKAFCSILSSKACKIHDDTVFCPARYIYE